MFNTINQGDINFQYEIEKDDEVKISFSKIIKNHDLKIK